MVVLTDRRDQVVRELTKHCGDGRLTLDELEARIEEAYAAESIDELQAVLRDLPADDAAARPAPAVAAPSKARAERKAPGLPPLPSLPPLPALPKRVEADWHGSARAAITVGGFIALITVGFWLALVIWVLLPALLVHKKTCR
ncbi:MAG TPA: DUF1707 domain-containing protein [Acidimicrobiales bacterium]|nr:DUF1707 domain-containing protein [Acidimicrobiales bacterium]